MTGEKMSALKQLIKAKKEKKKRQEKETNRFFLLQNLNYKDAAHPLLRVDVYLGIKELVTVIIFPWPIGDHLFKVLGIANEAWI